MDTWLKAGAFSQALMRKVDRRVSLFPLLLLSGCLQFDLENTVSWSPSGRRVAFLSSGRGWVYALEEGRLSELSVPGSWRSLLWSPREEWIAVSTDTRLELLHEEEGAFHSRRSYAFASPVPSSDLPGLMMWHPSGERLLYSQVGEQSAETRELLLSVSSAAAAAAGEGIGFYGPGGEWLLWASRAAVGRRRDKTLWDRQSPSGEPLPLAREAEAWLEASFFELLASAADNAELPLCAGRHEAESKSTEYSCLDASGTLARRLLLPAQARVFADRARRLFAAVVEGEKGLLLSIHDARGRPQARGGSFLKALREKADLRTEGASEAERASRVSRLAWSPDGRWLAWVVNGRLCLWDWRADEVRVAGPS